MRLVHTSYSSFPQLFSISLYAFLETVDLLLGFEVPFSFLALILLTKEFFTPFLFFFAVLLFFVADFLEEAFDAAFFGAIAVTEEKEIMRA